MTRCLAPSGDKRKYLNIGLPSPLLVEPTLVELGVGGTKVRRFPLTLGDSRSPHVYGLESSCPPQATWRCSRRQAKAQSGAFCTPQMPVPVELTRRRSMTHSPSTAVSCCRMVSGRPCRSMLLASCVTLGW